MAEQNEKPKSRVIRYEYEMADNGAILVDKDLTAVYVCTDDHNEKVKMVGEEIYGNIAAFLEDAETVAARVTIKLEKIEPKY